MKIGGLQKLTLLDYPGKTAATVFTIGCNFRCPFCHNADLVIPSSPSSSFGITPTISEKDFFSFLQKRKGLLDGICITGGEPTLQYDLASFCNAIKREGFLVKLDTNGANPEIVQDLIENSLIDYVALDVKNSPERYRETCGLQTITAQACITPNHGASSSTTSEKFTDTSPNTRSLCAHAPVAEVDQTMRLLFESGIPFELRTTVVKGLHNKQDLINLANWIASTASKTPVNTIPWFIQSFMDSETVLAGEGCYTPWTEENLRALIPKLQKILPDTALRGM